MAVFLKPRSGKNVSQGFGGVTLLFLKSLFLFAPDIEGSNRPHATNDSILVYLGQAVSLLGSLPAESGPYSCFLEKCG